LFKYPLFGGFAWSRKAPHLRHFRPSVRMYQRGSHTTVLGILRKSVEKLQIWLKSGKKIGHFKRRPEYTLFLPVTLNCYKSAIFESNFVSLFD